MELGGCSSSSSSSSLCLQQLTALLRTEKNSCCVSTRDWSISSKKRATTLSSISTRTFSVSYRKFVDFALDETTSHTHLFSSPLQVLDFTVFPRAEYDVPIFCANFFTTARTNIVVLDLNPLHDVINQRHYKEKYFKSLIPLGLKYAELFPWGGKLTSESIKFFSPIVIWTKFNSSPEKYEILYSAFKDYYKVWLELVSKSDKETDESQISRNLEAQHRYLVWRAEKDPGQSVLKKLIGETLAKDLLRGFLFNGVDVLGSKTFNDYFPHYCSKDGDLNNKGSIIGKSFENRPWDERGEFLGEGIIP
ncbi:hypothetical protein Ahy_A07g031084 [Arachis hypogaea]|uniref:Phytochromobilin:ferredoxin oxidoreductase n=1 Tax=Arachis hypogaea TaxID=3818 RepID=A0A445C2S6_ARAHY|nr:hypothetical protein Ahy_A07g031084 [Arachis hypogaea]